MHMNVHFDAEPFTIWEIRRQERKKGKTKSRQGEMRSASESLPIKDSVCNLSLKRQKALGRNL